MIIKKFLILLLLGVMLLGIVSCGKEEVSKGFDGMEEDVSLNQDGSLIAKTTKIEGKNSYKLTISGSGKAATYNKKEFVPWNTIRKAISEIEIVEGVKYIGDYFFVGMNLEEIFLPSSIEEVSDNAFDEGTKIYSYSNKVQSEVFKIYYYSETAPTQAGNYFHLIDGKAFIWELISFLFIGNSFTYYLGSTSDPMIPKYFGLIASDLGMNVTVDSVVQGSHTLEKFANPNDDFGAIVDQKLSTNQYDYIILQEQSTTPYNYYDKFKNAVEKLKDKIEATQDNAKIYLYETWGSPATTNSEDPAQIKAMEKQLDTAYTNCAKEFNLSVTYVGRAFSYVYEHYRSSINIYHTDSRHPSEAGAYLSALVHVATMLGLDVTKTNFNANLDKEKANILKEVASQVATNKIK